MNAVLFFIADALSIFLSAIIYGVYFKIFGTKQVKSKKINLLLNIGYIIIGTLITTFLPFEFSVALLLMVVFALSFIYKMPMIKRILSVVVIYLFFALVEILISLLLGATLGITVEQLQVNIVAYVIGVLLSKVLVYIIIKIGFFKVNLKETKLPKITIVAFIVLPITTFMVLFYVSKALYYSGNEFDKIFGFIISVLMVAANMITFYIFNHISREKEKEKEMEATAMRLENERQYYHDLYTKQSIEDKVSHDIKHKIYALGDLIITDAAKAKKEISSIMTALNEVSALKVTGYVSVDALINNKAHEAKENGLELSVKSSIASPEGIEAIDLCVILGNLLDNAIESSMKVESEVIKVIELTLKQKNNLLIIHTMNLCDANNVEKDFKTSKKSSKHGFGLKNIKEIATKYNGYVDLAIENNQFNANIILELKNHVN